MSEALRTAWTTFKSAHDPQSANEAAWRAGLVQVLNLLIDKEAPPEQAAVAPPPPDRLVAAAEKGADALAVLVSLQGSGSMLMHAKMLLDLAAPRLDQAQPELRLILAELCQCFGVTVPADGPKVEEHADLAETGQPAAQLDPAALQAAMDQLIKPVGPPALSLVPPVVDAPTASAAADGVPQEAADDTQTAKRPSGNTPPPYEDMQIVAPPPEAPPPAPPVVSAAPDAETL